ncbi:MAG: DUF4258 domain-containing protein [Thermococcus sp.]|uniref:DUF4258 domain-containing protein n=1 Tax=Thermococcus sp. TaxID=35749 RepID=UPI001D206A59|nr:DUF4258 domain-containing protein [Thermococcus sp.]MBO8175060.1 DUF4258 domain-containing protein [Thermococcus sp.]
MNESDILFIPHALERMNERGISKDLVIGALTNPDKVEEGHFGRKVAQKNIDGKLIRVIYEEHEDEIIVITAYITSKVDKYLR